MAFCTKCGTGLDEGTRFCANCGTAIDEIRTEEQNPYAPPQQSVPNFTVRRNPWQYFTDALKKYAVFQGRARRSEYWWFTLFIAIISVITGILDSIFDLYIAGDKGVISTLLSLAVLMPSWCVAVRRLHDCDKSGWFMLIPIYNLILYCTNGTPGPNRFGTDPKAKNPMPEM